MNCPYCLSTTFHPPFAVQEMVNGSKESFYYQECKFCGSVINSQFPDNISDYYKNYYSFSKSFSYLETNKIKQIIALIFKWVFVRTHFLRLIKLFIKWPPLLLMNNLHWNVQAFLYACPDYDEKILDVGSGYGELITVIRKFGYINIQGIDPFLPPEKETIYMKRKKIHELIISKPFDMIMFNHSFEHLDDPEDHIKSASNMIKQNGLIIIHIPNLESLDRAEFKGSWYGYHAPFHYSIPTRQGLNMMASRHGLKIIDAIGTSRWDLHLFSQDYALGIADNDPKSVRRQIEQGNFDSKIHIKMQKMARHLNIRKQGESISYYLIKL